MILWPAFLVLILSLLAIDLGVVNRRPHRISVREATAWTGVWVALALLFGVFVYFLYDRHWLGVGLTVGDPLTGRQAALQYLTAYLVEKSLSLDNIFVIAVIFGYFRVPDKLQHRVLYWGILGALVMRGIMIGAGAVLIRRFVWMTYVFGAFLLLTAVRFLRDHQGEVEPEHNPLVRLARRIYPVTRDFEGPRFFSTHEGKRAVTPLFIVLLVVESSDVMFAVDSIPAVFAITRDPFLVFTSNVMAILGLRSLFFVLVGVLGRFRYLKQSLALVLGYVGGKMMLAHAVHIPAPVSLGVIMGILTGGVLLSVLRAPKEG
jgi:tellurite resistance protein TerC